VKKRCSRAATCPPAGGRSPTYSTGGRGSSRRP